MDECVDKVSFGPACHIRFLAGDRQRLAADHAIGGSCDIIGFGKAETPALLPGKERGKMAFAK